MFEKTHSAFRSENHLIAKNHRLGLLYPNLNRFYFKTASVGAGAEWNSWNAAFGSQIGADSSFGIRHVSEYDGWLNFPNCSVTYGLPIDGSTLSAGTDYYYHMLLNQDLQHHFQNYHKTCHLKQLY